ncbi:aspartic proteinase CDR1-like [Impatiens glandulifera]|uniref:aspartic proteinase CDR1-like n=1 Tax=Impatiens glandulifera TaxID=253017 RepID=UPI001FB0FAAC|nr:aspartic proteinase CDR1-like [Impatiens glandulifera]
MYSMEIYVGTPPAKQAVMVDTGSDITWIQCRSCVNCFEQNQPIFNPDQSSSFKRLRCDSNECLKLGSKRVCTQPNLNCKYGLAYTGGSRSNGELVKETYIIGRTSIPNIAHGCGYNNIGTYDVKSTGMIGLGDGPLSFITQTKHLIGGMFSYCLVSEFGSNQNAKSMISFGNNAAMNENQHGVMSTPLTKKSDSPHYYLTLRSISVGSKLIPMRRESGNIMIDTSAIFSYLPSHVIQKLMDAIREETNEPPLDIPNPNELCFDIDANVPIITFHFSNSASVVLSKMNAFSIIRDILCFDIKKDDDLSVFGSQAQTDFLIGYNIPRKKVYFKPTDCSRHVITP